MSRENKDGIYTAPMDHSYRAVMGGNNNGHKGGRPRPGFTTQYSQPDPEPLPPSVDANSRIFAFIEDLFFMAKIQETAKKLYVKVEFVKSDKDLMEKMQANGEEKPSLIIVDLNSNGINGGQLDQHSFVLNWYLNDNTKIQFQYSNIMRNVAGPAVSGTVHGFGVLGQWYF